MTITQTILSKIPDNKGITLEAKEAIEFLKESTYPAITQKEADEIKERIEELSKDYDFAWYNVERNHTIYCLKDKLKNSKVI